MGSICSNFQELLYAQYVDKNCMLIKVCDICQGTKIKALKNKTTYPKILDYFLMESLSVSILCVPEGLDNFKYLLVATCKNNQFLLAIAIKAKLTIHSQILGL